MYRALLLGAVPPALVTDAVRLLAAGRPGEGGGAAFLSGEAAQAYYGREGGGDVSAVYSWCTFFVSREMGVLGDLSWSWLDVLERRGCGGVMAGFGDGWLCCALAPHRGIRRWGEGLPMRWCRRNAHKLNGCDQQGVGGSKHDI